MICGKSTWHGSFSRLKAVAGIYSKKQKTSMGVCVPNFRLVSFFIWPGDVTQKIHKYRSEIRNILVRLKKQHLRLKSAIFQAMSRKFGFKIIREPGIRIWNRILDISIPSGPKSRSKNQNTVKKHFVRALHFKFFCCWFLNILRLLLDHNMYL